MKFRGLVGWSVLVVALAISASAQSYNEAQFKAMQWGDIGPFRGGRVLAVTGIPGSPFTYYFGGVAGGVWRTTDGGVSWQPISDNSMISSIGAIAVSESNPNVIYVGTGESCLRGNISYGDGMYKTTDGGKTWQHIGLKDTQHIARVWIDPRNSDHVLIAALGHAYGPNTERGIFRTTDGGKTWDKILYKDDKSGGIDLAVDPHNPNVIFAALYQIQRSPWGLESGGPGSGLYRSTDGGNSWSHLEGKGLPDGILGRIGVSVSGADSNRVYALIESKQSGLYRSDDSGETWSRVNDDQRLTQRAWYFTHIFADPKSADTVYMLNTGVFRSTDGGKTLNLLPAPHGDHHGFWIDPQNPNRMINGNDGGASISVDGGKSWSTEYNQPTAQFYHLAADNDFLYKVYGAQQDNSTVGIATRTDDGYIGRQHWFDAGGGESGYLAPDPRDSNIIYAGSGSGVVTRLDRRSNQEQDITVWPEDTSGHGVGDLKFRLGWTQPIEISPHDPNVIYTSAERVFKTTDEGKSWTAISPDLTRNDKSKQISSGGPLTKDNTSVEYYDTVFTIAESPAQKDLLWAGTDDGLIHLTRDGGKNWTNVTPKDFPDFIRVNCVAASPLDAGTAYVAATMYLSDDFRPFLYKTNDYGKTWKKITNGIPAEDFTRTIRADTKIKGLLFAGTEAHLYLSYNDGDNWIPFQLNLPNVPITDLTIQKREDDLVVATQGRSFYVLDDLPLIRELAPGKLPENSAHLFEPKPAYRYAGGGGFERAQPATGKNPPNGVVIYYSLKTKPTSDVGLKFMDSSGKLIREVSSKAEPKEAPSMEDDERPAAPKPTAKVGLNRFAWDLHYADATRFPGIILWAASLRGPQIVPGTYTVQLTVDGHTETQKFVVKKDPRTPTTPDDFNKQLELALQIRDRISEANQAVTDIRAARHQLDEYAKSSDAKISSSAKAILAKLDPIENAIYQTKLRANEDALNFPIKLNNKLASLLSTVTATDIAPTSQSYEVFKELSEQLQVQLDQLKQVEAHDIAEFNKVVRDQNIPAIPMKSSE